MARLNNPIPVRWRDDSDGPVLQLGRDGVPMARNTSRRIQTQSGKKVQYRAFFSDLTTRWQSFTIAEKDAWVVFSMNNPILDRYGFLIEIGGYQWYIRLNTILKQAGQPAIDSPPADPSPSYTPTFAPAQSLPSGNIIAQPNPAPSTGEYFFVQRFLNAQLSLIAPTNKTRFFGMFDDSNTDNFTIAFASELRPGPQRHKFTFHAGDSAGRTGDLIFDDVLLGTV